MTLKIGRFATLRGLLQAQGIGASARSLVAAPPVALCVLLAFCVGVAQAEPPKLISYGLFGSQEAHAVGVAVEGSGDLFVSSLFEGSPLVPSGVVKLGPSGDLISPPSPFGSAHYSGVAVNPTNGDVYVLGEESLFAPATIFVYDPDTGAPTGAPVSSFEVPASRNFSGFFTDVQIAVDSAGDVYVPVVPENEVLEYSPSGTLLKTFTGSGAGVLEEPTGVAVDSSGNLWVAGDNRIVELDSGDAPVEVNGKPVEIGSEGVWSVALDGHGDVLGLVSNDADACGEMSAPCLHLVEYGSEGRQLADVGAGSFGVPETGATTRFYSGVAVNEASGRVYVMDGLKETVWVFGPPTAPVVGKELTAEVGVSEAKLGALVNPGGIETSYRFEYGPTNAYGSSAPFPDGSVGEGVESHAVWASASGLAPGSTYHYRVVASNEVGTIYGPDQTFTTLSAEQAACPNEQRRGGFSARLPDCRAYELVTPLVEVSSQFDASSGTSYSSTAAASGEAITLRAQEPQPGAPSAGEYYVATRGVGGWSAEDIMPIESYDGVACLEFQPVYAYSDQLTKDLLQAGGGSRGSASGNFHENPESCNPEGSQVVSGEPVGYENLLVRDNATDTYRLVNVTPPGVTPADAHFQVASADLSHVIFTETSPLTEGAQYGVANLYEWDEGALRLVSVLPDGAAVPGSLAVEATAAPWTREAEREAVIASDGSHVLFTYGGALYDRIDGRRTVQVDEQQGGSGPSGGGSFTAATSDGSRVLFLDEGKLTANSTASAGEPDLYECALPEGASKCELTDLTAEAGGHADVQRVMPLGEHDSSDVYFVAKGVLASNTREFTNSEGKSVAEGAQPGRENLYLWNGEKTTFITAGIYYGGLRLDDEQTSPDGEWLAFDSKQSLTGYDNVEPDGESAAELFLYGAGSGSHPPTLVCASCDPTGEAPATGGGMVQHEQQSDEGTFGFFRSRHLLTDAGQVFFQTSDALVPSDTNGELDVYEYERGHVYLISSGTSSYESNLEDASESGDDVFFRSDQQLAPQDTQEGEIVIYDARIDGGFPAPASPPPCTTADACRAPAATQPSIYGAPSSQTFEGAGNLTSSTKATTKKQVKKKKAKLERKVCQKTHGKRRACAVKPKKRKHGQRKVKSLRRGRR